MKKTAQHTNNDFIDYIDLEADDELFEKREKRNYVPELIVESFRPQFCENLPLLQSELEFNRTEAYPPLLSEFLPGEQPPLPDTANLPEHFTNAHCVAFLYLNLWTLGILDDEETIDLSDFDLLAYELINTTTIREPITADVVTWHNSLTPDDVKCFGWSVIKHLKYSLDENTLYNLLLELATRIDEETDPRGEQQKFVDYLTCAFLDKLPRASRVSVFTNRDSLQSDPLGWLPLHDLVTLLIYIGDLKPDGMTDPDLTSMRFAAANGREILDVDTTLDLDLVFDQVDEALYTNGRTNPDLQRVSRSNWNLLDFFRTSSQDQDAWRNLFFNIYKSIRFWSEIPPNLEQKTTLKQLFMFWHAYIDLSKEIDLIDFCSIEGLNHYPPTHYDIAK